MNRLLIALIATLALAGAPQAPRAQERQPANDSGPAAGANMGAVYQPKGMQVAPGAGKQATPSFSGGPGAGAQAVVPGQRVQPGPVVPAPVGYALRTELWTPQSRFPIGGTLDLFFRVSEDSYVYLFNVDTTGRLTQIFPNYFDRANRVRGGRTYRVPDASYQLNLTPPAGTETITMVAVSEKYPAMMVYETYGPGNEYPTNIPNPDQILIQLSMGGGSGGGQPVYSGGGQPTYPTAGQPYPGGQQPIPDKGAMGFPAGGNTTPGASSQAVVPGQRVQPVPVVPAPVPVVPVPVYRYGASSLAFSTYDAGPIQPVVPVYPPSQPVPVIPVPVVPQPASTLNLRSSPRGAQVYLNGVMYGSTPLTVSLAPGRYEVLMQRQGFYAESFITDILPGENRRIEKRLRPLGSRLNFSIGNEDGQIDFSIGGGDRRR